jgi:hypothetical protein
VEGSGGRGYPKDCGSAACGAADVEDCLTLFFNQNRKVYNRERTLTRYSNCEIPVQRILREF